MNLKAERTPWGDFPRVIRNGELGSLQREPEYLAAKSGDRGAALDMVLRLLSDETIRHIREQIGDSRPVVLPVLAVEAAGNNMIPLAIAEILAERLDLGRNLSIIQREKVGRTGKGADHRLAFNPTFEGEVRAGQAYLIVDDTLTMGGTIASLRGYVENRGGSVVAAMVMTAHEGALDLAVRPKMLADIEGKHGEKMNQFWQERHLAMASKDSHKAKQGTSERPRVLTPSEIESLRREMKEAGEWMREAIHRRQKKREGKKNSSG